MGTQDNSLYRMHSCNTSIIQIYSTMVSLYKATEAGKKQLGPRAAKICPTLKKNADL
jgi:hypothetical protein